MSYSISLYGHGVPAETAKTVFETAVRTLRAATEEGGGPPGGSIFANDGDGGSISLGAADVADAEPEVDLVL